MRKKLAVLLAVLAVVLLVGVYTFGAAFAADPTPTLTNQQDVYLGKVAKILGIDQEKLESAFTQARSEMLDDAVKEGKMTQQQADWMKEGMQQGWLGKGPGHGFRPALGHGGRGGGFMMRGMQKGTTAPTPGPAS